MILKSQRAFAKKAFYAGVGAPVVAGRVAKGYAERITAQGSKLGKAAQSQFDELAKEGEKVAGQLRETDVMEEIQSRVDFEKVQDRVEKMRDQLEGALESWRESFTPETRTPAAAKPAAKKAPAAKPAAKKPATKAATKPAAKKPAATKPAAKPAAKKTTAARSTASKKTTATAKK